MTHTRTYPIRHPQMPSALRNVIYKMFKISAQGLTDKSYSLKINISRRSGPQLTFALVFT